MLSEEHVASLLATCSDCMSFRSLLISDLFAEHCLACDAGRLSNYQQVKGMVTSYVHSFCFQVSAACFSCLLVLCSCLNWLMWVHQSLGRDWFLLIRFLTKTSKCCNFKCWLFGKVWCDCGSPCFPVCPSGPPWPADCILQHPADVGSDGGDAIQSDNNFHWPLRCKWNTQISTQSQPRL